MTTALNLQKKFFIALATVAAVFCLCGASAFAMGTDVQQTNANVNLRTGPGVGYDKITVVPVGTTVYIEQNLGDWCYVDYNAPSGTVTGYLCSQYLGSYKPAAVQQWNPSSSGAGYYNVVSYSAVNMRGGPSTNYGILTVVPAGGSIYVSSSSNGWSAVSYGGYNGYIATQYIAGLGAASNSTSSSGTTHHGVSNPAYAGQSVLSAHDFTQMYAATDTGAAIIQTLCAGTRLTILGSAPGWYQVSNGGTNGWVLASSLCRDIGGPCLTA